MSGPLLRRGSLVSVRDHGSMKAKTMGEQIESWIEEMVEREGGTSLVSEHSQDQEQGPSQRLRAEFALRQLQKQPPKAPKQSPHGSILQEQVSHCELVSINRGRK